MPPCIYLFINSAIDLLSHVISHLINSFSISDLFTVCILGQNCPSLIYFMHGLAYSFINWAVYIFIFLILAGSVPHRETNLRWVCNWEGKCFSYFYWSEPKSIHFQHSTLISDTWKRNKWINVTEISQTAFSISMFYWFGKVLKTEYIISQL